MLRASVVGAEMFCIYWWVYIGLLAVGDTLNFCKYKVSWPFRM